MKTRRILGGFLVALALVGGPVFFGGTALATVITLDGVANAGWSTDDLTKAHLYIANPDLAPTNPAYYDFKWTYGSGPLPWSSLNNMVTSLLGGQIVGQGNWKIESGGDVFGNPGNPIWKYLNLVAGTYTLNLTPNSHAYDLTAYTWPQENPRHEWNDYVQILAVSPSGSESFSFGGYNGYWQTTESAALQFYRANVDGMEITLPQDSTVYFFINDYNSVDNAGSVSLEIEAVPIPGSILLLGPGLAWLLASRMRRRHLS
jgi:hypothetical protein